MIICLKERARNNENLGRWLFSVLFLKIKGMINWRQLYNESQTIQPEDTDISTEVINLFSK